jgi:hypothetical protein
MNLRMPRRLRRMRRLAYSTGVVLLAFFVNLDRALPNFRLAGQPLTEVSVAKITA